MIWLREAADALRERRLRAKNYGHEINIPAYQGGL